MKRKSPISVDRIQFHAYNRDQACNTAAIDQFPYDDRQDFLADSGFAGFAVKVGLSNHRSDRGVRRDISLTLVDMTRRCEADTQTVRIHLVPHGFEERCIQFPADTPDIVGGHTYKLVICDLTAGSSIAERIIHMLDPSAMGDPAGWYQVCSAGVRPSWEHDMYKSLHTIDSHDYLVRFTVAPSMHCMLPSVMPELEIRLYSPAGENVKTVFKEPFCRNLDSYNDNRWAVECPFETAGDINGVFYAELRCMGHAVAGCVFDTLNDGDIRGVWAGHDIKPMGHYSHQAAKALLDKRLDRAGRPAPAPSADPLAEAIDRFLASQLDDNGTAAPESAPQQVEADEADDAANKPALSLDDLTGLRAVKDKLSVYERVVRFNKMRARKGLPVTEAPLHAMFLGSPGTGKTTVAKLIGSMLHQTGVLSKGHVVVRERASLLGQYYHSETEKTLEALEQAQGGILFIDEAYQLYQPNDARDPGRFVIEALLTALSDDTARDWMLILAGYPDEMKRMLDMNPGLKSRIPDTNIYTFDDFTEAEMMEIAENYLGRNNYTLTEGARTALAHRLKADWCLRDKSFGNARHVMNIIQAEILPAMADRVVGRGLTDYTSLTSICASDIPAPADKGATPRPHIGFAV